MVWTEENSLLLLLSRSLQALHRWRPPQEERVLVSVLELVDDLLLRRRAMLLQLLFGGNQKANTSASPELIM